MYVCYLQFQDDAVLIPRETAWFGYYPDGAFDPVLPPQKVELIHARELGPPPCVLCLQWQALCVQTKLYEEDWIGLKTLDEAGRVKFVSVPGGHLGISKGDMKKYIVPYLTNKKASVTVSDLLVAIWHAVLGLALAEGDDAVLI
jgi:palmitoyl-protein thioesterase